MKIDCFKVHLLLAEKNLRQLDLAEKSNVSIATINNVLNGKNASYRTIYNLSKALDVPVRDIVAME